MPAKLKSFLRSEQTIMAILLCAIALASFALGRQSVESPTVAGQSTYQEAGVVFVDAPKAAVASDAVPVAASKNGTKYHRLDCPGATTIKEANLIRFASVDLARAAGYEPAGNCDF